MLKKKQIAGLSYISSFLTKGQEKDLIETILQQDEWNQSLKRRTQHYGYQYSYKQTNSVSKVKPIPGLLKLIQIKIQQYLSQKTQEPYLFDMLIVNQYEPGQGISAHIDNPILFDSVIAIISLGSDIIMQFQGPMGQKKQLLLQRKSLMILEGESRYKWKHSIASRKKDYGIFRNTRYSLTYRKVNDKFK